MCVRHRGVSVFSPQSREVPAIRVVQQALDAQRRPSALQGRWSPPPLHRMYFNNVLGSGELQQHPTFFIHSFSYRASGISSVLYVHDPPRHAVAAAILTGYKGITPPHLTVLMADEPLADVPRLPRLYDSHRATAAVGDACSIGVLCCLEGICCCQRTR